LNTAQEGEPVLLEGSDGKRFLIKLQPGAQFHTHRGVVDHDQIIGRPLGRKIVSHLGHPFAVLKPSVHDLLMTLKRVSQIVYPKDIGLILLKLSVGSGSRVVEAGTGSGALTLALAHSVRPDGQVYSYDAREDMLNVAAKNLANVGLADGVTLIQRDISEGFSQEGVDSLFLDVREPWDYLSQACDALADGGFFGAIVPTTNQVSDLLVGMRGHPFSSIEVVELLLRKYKPVAARLRPQDRMVAHTGYLVFARKIAPLSAQSSDYCSPAARRRGVGSLRDDR